MQRLSSALRGGDVSGLRLKPAAVSARCRYCGEVGVFTCTGHQEGPINSISCREMPQLQQAAGFWTVNSLSETSQGKIPIYMYPAATFFTCAISDYQRPVKRERNYMLICSVVGR